MPPDVKMAKRWNHLASTQNFYSLPPLLSCAILSQTQFCWITNFTIFWAWCILKFSLHFESMDLHGGSMLVHRLVSGVEAPLQPRAWWTGWNYWAQGVEEKRPETAEPTVQPQWSSATTRVRLCSLLGTAATNVSEKKSCTHPTWNTSNTRRRQ